MALPATFVESFQLMPLRDALTDLRMQAHSGELSTIELQNEIRPADLFCYLGGRFGPPNGFQNVLRSDSSDNLIHWDWTLRHSGGVVMFLGMNFRTEISVTGIPIESGDKEMLIDQLKADFGNYGKEMGAVRQHLEHWTEFVNPYQRIKRAVERLVSSLEELDLQPARDRLDPLAAPLDTDATLRWAEASKRYSQGFGLCFGIRSMLPVMAEAFVNLLLYVLMRPELRTDERLRENAFRQPIDVRIKSLSITCVGFNRQPDYSHDACRAYHRLVNERNDLLHGNVVIDKLKFNEVYFWERVPVFKQYRSMWERSLQVEADAVGLDSLQPELDTVNALTEYLLSCVDDTLREQLSFLVGRHELGLNQKGGRIGVLFSGSLVDFRSGPRASATGVEPAGQSSEGHSP